MIVTSGPGASAGLIKNSSTTPQRQNNRGEKVNNAPGSNTLCYNRKREQIRDRTRIRIQLQNTLTITVIQIRFERRRRQ